MQLLIFIVFSQVCGTLCAIIPTTNFEDADDFDQRSNIDERGIGFEGDMMLPASLFSGLVNPRRRWPDATIPYQINETFTAQERSTIAAGMEDIASKTCIIFKVHTTESDYISVQRTQSNGCNSMVGRIGGKQDLNLQSPGCITKGIVSHEFIHAIGFRHEHSRSDRDEYIDIKWENIQPRYYSAFRKYGPETVDSFGVPFDYQSIMLYGKYAFGNKQGPSIIPKKPNVEIGQRRALSESDAEKINRMYNCKGQ